MLQISDLNDRLRDDSAKRTAIAAATELLTSPGTHTKHCPRQSSPHEEHHLPHTMSPWKLFHQYVDIKLHVVAAVEVAPSYNEYFGIDLSMPTIQHNL